MPSSKTISIYQLLYLKNKFKNKPSYFRDLLLSTEGKIAQLKQFIPIKIVPKNHQFISRQLKVLDLYDIEILPIWKFPKHLKILNPPALLFCRGNINLLRQRGVGVIGSRQSGINIKNWLHDWIKEVKPQLIVSGGAQGVDTFAHEISLKENIKTIVFLGTAIDNIYPKCNQQLFRDILNSKGLLVSEIGPLEHSKKQFFSRRNRFIASASKYLMIGEAGLKSGTLITAKYAHRLGLPIFTPPLIVPEHIEGLNYLIEQSWAEEYLF